jgi:hypothetical protein
MKHLALLLVIVGVSLAAAFGARNTDTLLERQQSAIPGTHFARERDNAKEVYCDARKEAKLSDHPECEPASKTKATPNESAEKKSFEELVAAGQKELAVIKSLTEELPLEVFEKRDAWVQAFGKAIEPEATKGMITAPPKPGARLSAWAMSNGLFFSVGLVLIVIGGLLTRKIDREAATSSKPGESSDSAGPVDFGALLKQLQTEATSLHAELSANEDPSPEDFEQAQQKIESLQFERVERLVDNRIGLQVRYGVGGFAQVFGPMSAGERNLNRTWSALVDQHWPEAMASLQNATVQLDEACRQMEAVVAAAD